MPDYAKPRPVFSLGPNRGGGRWLVFTDLDGTLLDHYDYGYAAAKPVMERLEAWGIPVHLASSKTFAEGIAYYREWGVRRPMIVENGAAVAVPAEECSADWGPEAADGYRVRPMGPDYASLRAALTELRARDGLDVQGFGDWTAADVARHTGLDEDAAERARQRAGTEPVIWSDSDAALERFGADLQARGLRIVRGGRFHHIMGQTDKASGVNAVVALYARQWDEPIRTLCLGDSENDRAMLESANCTIVVRRTDGVHLAVNRDGDTCFTESPSPRGWAEGVEIWLDS
ncbi:MAG: HAD-IIB family hydrolase [Gammaproteobacteria bacterium]